MIALGADGKPSFHEIMRRDLIRRTERIQAAYEAVPATYMLFDIVYLNGEWVHRKPLQERLELLHQIIIPNERIQLAPAHPDGQALFQVMCSQGMEGIVCKNWIVPTHWADRTDDGSRSKIMAISLPLSVAIP